MTKKKNSNFKHHLPYITAVSIVVVIGIVILVVTYVSSQQAIAGEAFRARSLSQPSVQIKENAVITKTAATSEQIKESSHKVTCPGTFMPTGITPPDGFKMTELKLSGVMCLPSGVECVYDSVGALSFNEDTLDDIKPKDIVGSLSISAVPPEGQTWSKCVHSGLAQCTCDVS